MSQEDAEFLAVLQIEDAVTLSEKVRALIKRARHRHQQKTDYDSYLKFMGDILNNLNHQVKLAEVNLGLHSEMVTYFLEWSVESFAFIASMQQQEDVDEETLKVLERGIVKRIFRLFETTTRMGITKKAPCYDEAIISQNFDGIIELVELINLRLTAAQKK